MLLVSAGGQSLQLSSDRASVRCYYPLVPPAIFPRAFGIDHVGVENLIAAAKEAGIARFVLVTSFGCGGSRVAVPPPLLEKIGAALSEKDKAEDSLRASGLSFTILRPGGLSEGPGTGRGVLTDSNDVLGGITRADVAIGVVNCLNSEKSVGQTLGLIDRDQVRAGTLHEVTIG